MLTNKSRYYLVLDDIIQHIGIDTTRRFPYYAGKTLPCVEVVYTNDELLRVGILSYVVGNDGKPELSILELIKAVQEVNRKDKEDKGPVYYMSHDIKNPLTSIQKELLNQKLIKDFGKCWEHFNEIGKARFWKYGDSIDHL